MTAIRTVIVDDHLVYREGIKTVLRATGVNVEIVGEAADGLEALEMVERTRPDVVLMDLAMPGMGGLEAIQEIVHRHPGTAVLVLTMTDDDSVLAAMRAGARGYLLKDGSVSDLERAIEAVACGDTILTPRAAARLTEHLAAEPRNTSVFPNLTDREHEVLRLVLDGLSNADVGSRLFLSPKTVRNYVSAILTKVQVDNRAQLIVKAREAGYPGRPTRPDS